MERVITYLERILLGVVNLLFTLIPQRHPHNQALADCKIVSHRGEHDNRCVRENTLAAFTQPAEAGCWGLEFDVRWTRDLQPVVIHDVNAKRVFGIDLVVAEVSLQELQQRIPEVPTLAQVVARFGGRQHLMVELKHDKLGAIAARAERLREILAPLESATDYHILALQPALFELVEFAGQRACLAVAELHVGAASRLASARDFGGICAQYLLLSDNLLRHHHHRGQKLGSGFASSRNCLYREINRGVDWIFTNHALRLEAIRRRALDQG